MPVFIILVLLGAVVLWLLLSSVYFEVGDFISGLWKDAKDAMNEDNDEEEDQDE